jgi:sigma-B regulation protein RsbU (phosphoserine phosphatase)
MLLAIFTDGVTETVNGADEEYGEECLVQALRDSQSRSPVGIYHYITDQVRKWQGTQKQHDDITLIIAKVS